MPDAVPNPRVGQQRLRSQIAAQKSNIERQKLEILEMADRRQRNLENIAASEDAIRSLEADLKAMSIAHGPFTEQEYEDMSGSVEAALPEES